MSRVSWYGYVNVRFQCSTKIDISNYSRIELEFDRAGNVINAITIGVAGVSDTSDYDVSKKETYSMTDTSTSVRNILSLDISNVEGEKYFYIFVETPNNGAGSGGNLISYLRVRSIIAYK